MEWVHNRKNISEDKEDLKNNEVKLTGFRLGEENNYPRSPSANGHVNLGFIHDPTNNENSVCKQWANDSFGGPNITGPKFTRCRWSGVMMTPRRRLCSRKVLTKRLPFLTNVANYTAEQAVADLVAGVTVGLTVIPQAIAYANVAGLAPQYGLYSSFIGCFVYALFGSIKDSPIGPTAIMSILTRENLHGFGASGAIVLAFLTGIVQLVMGVAQIGFLVDFISGPVSVGFTSAAAIVIATTQIKDLLGLTYSASSFLGVWDQLACHIRETKICDAALGLTCMTILLLLRKVKDIQIGPSDTKSQTNSQRFLARTLWFISTARNILVVVICAVLAYVFHLHEMTPFALSGAVKDGLPHFQPPPFQIETNNVTFSFVDLVSDLSSAVVVIPLLSLLEDISLAKVFSDGKPIDATQELIALGLCNVAGAFVGSMPVSGALSRGAVNNASGVRTTLGGVYTGIIVIVSLQFFTPYFYFIPKASLAAVIIAAVVFMVEFHVVKPIWKTNKIDLIPAAATFICCLLLRLELGIFIGIGTNILFLLYASARPSVQVERLKSPWGCDYLVITPDRSLVFPSVEYVRNMITKAGVKQGASSIPVVIDSRHVQGADFTAAKGIKSLIDDFIKRNQPLLFYNLKPSVVEVFQAVQPVSFYHCETESDLFAALMSYSPKLCA